MKKTLPFKLPLCVDDFNDYVDGSDREINPYSLDVMRTFVDAVNAQHGPVTKAKVRLLKKRLKLLRDELAPHCMDRDGPWECGRCSVCTTLAADAALAKKGKAKR